MRHVTAIAFVLSCAAVAHAAEEKLLCGFEAAEMKPANSRRYKYWVGKAWTIPKGTPPGWRFRANKDYHVPTGYKGDVTLYRSGSSRDYPLTTLAGTGDSQGSHALRKRFGRKVDFMARWGRLIMKPHVTEPARRGPTQLRDIMMYNSFRKFAKRFPRDWSGWDQLRLDVRSTKAGARFAVLLEDDECEPHLDRVYQLPAGKWVSLVFDLADASKSKLLDPAKMANILLAVEKVDGSTEVQVDNLRLSRRAAKSKFPLVEDKRPWRKPFLDAKLAEPSPVQVVAKRKTSAIEKTEPVVIDTSRIRLSYTRFSQLLHALPAFDNRYMAIAGSFGGGKSALVSTDGGKTWKGTGGAKKAAVLSRGHQSDRGVYVDDGGGLMGVTIMTCAGGSNRSDLYFRKLEFTGAGWKLKPFALVDIDVRHCPATTAVLRTSDGRIWAVWDHLNRQGRTALRLKCSDDDGKSWRRPSKSRFLDAQRTTLGGGPALASFGAKGVAVFWRRSDYHLFWSRTEDGKEWSKPELVARKTAIKTAVGVGGREVYFSSPVGGRMALSFQDKKAVKVMRWAGKDWTVEKGPWTKAAGKVTSPNLTVIAGRLCAAWCERAAGGDRVLLSVRGRDGDWGQAFEAAKEQSALENLVMPRSSPSNFVPLAWSPRNKKWVKVLRVPASSLGLPSR